jgi:hypothetical protein
LDAFPSSNIVLLSGLDLHSSSWIRFVEDFPDPVDIVDIG